MHSEKYGWAWLRCVILFCDAIALHRSDLEKQKIIKNELVNEFVNGHR